VFFLMAAAAAMALLLTARLAFWQVLDHQHITMLANEQHQVTFKLPAHRGRILDRNGQILATDVPVYNVVAAPDLVTAAARPSVARALAPLLGVDENKIAAQLAEPLKFEYLAHRLPQATADQVTALKLTGIGLEQDEQRSYLTSADAPPPAPVAAVPKPAPSPTPLPKTNPLSFIMVAPGIRPQPPGPRSLGSNLLGFVNYAGQGQYGIEQYWDSVLKGKDGYESTLKTGGDQSITLSDKQRVEPQDGKDIVLTIDSQIQYYAEQALAYGVAATGSEAGQVIVMEPQTGNIVAWADYPTYDANHFTTTDSALFKDAVVSGLYEPGSVMKVVTMSGGLDSGTVTPTTTFNDPGYTIVDGFRINDWDGKNHGTIDMTEVIRHSLNVGAVHVAQLEGLQTFMHYFDQFDIGKATGVKVAGEVAQGLEPAGQWHRSQLATRSYGQGVAVTPLQMLTAINAVANGGKLVEPRVVDSLVAADGTRTDMPYDPGKPVMSPQADTEMKQMMIQVVQNGASGFAAQINGWKNRVAGKTGTGNIPINGVYTNYTVASFVGFMPVENPRFTMLVVMHRPVGGGNWIEGSYAAGPTWHVIAQQIIAQWQMTP